MAISPFKHSCLNSPGSPFHPTAINAASSLLYLIRASISSSVKKATTAIAYLAHRMKLQRKQRPFIFQRLTYLEVTSHLRPGIIPRYGDTLELEIHNKLYAEEHE